MGRHDFKRLVLDNVNWRIEPRARIVILGHRMSGADILPDLLAGTVLPTSGWVERRAVVSMPGGLLRYAQDNLQQLIGRLSELYRVDPRDVTEFIAHGLERNDIFDVSPRRLPQLMWRQLGTLLIYAFPCDYYLFVNSAVPPGEGRFQTICRQAYEARSKQAGIIIKTNSSKVARRLGEDMMGALVYKGTVTLYRSIMDAAAVFDGLPPEAHEDPLDLQGEQQADAEGEFDLLV
jgi:capsular polysaccharide transport system ATP-binding protein